MRHIKHEKAYLTEEGLKKLNAEYQYLTTQKRHEVAERLQRAREMGTPEENSEYDLAREEQGFVEGRIEELEAVLKSAQVVKKKDVQVKIVEVGSSVTVEIENEEDVFQIVGSIEAEPEQGKISNESPVGKALLGLKEGDEVDVVTPHATLHYKIKRIG